MRIINDNLDLTDFKAWAGAVDTQETIIKEGKVQDFDYLIEELYPDGLTETHLNDILWHDSDWVYEILGIEIE